MDSVERLKISSKMWLLAFILFFGKEVIKCFLFDMPMFASLFYVVPLIWLFILILRRKEYLLIATLLFLIFEIFKIGLQLTGIEQLYSSLLIPIIEISVDLIVFVLVVLSRTLDKIEFSGE